MNGAPGDPPYRARYFNGETAKAFEVLLIGKVTAVSIIDASTGQELATWPHYRIRSLPEMDRQEPLTLALQDSVHNTEAYSDARLVVEDAATVHWLRAVCPDMDKKPPFGWHAARPYILWSGAAAGSLVLLFWVAIPLLAGVMVDVIPSRAQIALGEVVEQQVIRLFARTDAEGELVCNGAEGKAAIEEIVAQLAEAQSTGLPTSVKVLDVDQVNALALPGGRILVFKGLLDFVDHPNALAGVLAHELGHIAERHPLRGTIEKGASGVVIGLLLGDVTGGTAIAAAVEVATSAAYTREMEADADSFALDAMTTLGWDVEPFAAFFEDLAGEHPEPGGIFEILSTHPPSEERRKRAEAEMNKGGGDAVSATAWRAIRGICG